MITGFRDHEEMFVCEGQLHRAGEGLTLSQFNSLGSGSTDSSVDDRLAEAKSEIILQAASADFSFTPRVYVMTFVRLVIYRDGKKNQFLRCMVCKRLTDHAPAREMVLSTGRWRQSWSLQKITAPISATEDEDKISVLQKAVADAICLLRVLHNLTSHGDILRQGKPN